LSVAKIRELREQAHRCRELAFRSVSDVQVMESLRRYAETLEGEAKELEAALQEQTEQK
jgi:hypothetical protein